MKVSTACQIFKEIESDKYTDEVKGSAIYYILSMPTHNSITKDEMLAVIRFLFSFVYDLSGREAKKITRFDKVTESPEALAKVFCKLNGTGAFYEYLEWLESEVTENDPI